MIIHIIDSYWIPWQNKAKSKLQILRICQNFKLLNFEKTFHMTHLLKLFNKVCEYEMDAVCIVEDTEWTWFCPRMDRRMDGQMDRWTRWNQYTPLQLHWARGYNYNISNKEGKYSRQQSKNHSFKHWAKHLAILALLCLIQMCEIFSILTWYLLITLPLLSHAPIQKNQTHMRYTDLNQVMQRLAEFLPQKSSVNQVMCIHTTHHNHDVNK